MPTDLIASVRRQTHSIIDTELRRLARRAPTLTQHDLHIIGAALEDLAESSILAHLRTAPQTIAPLLARLFSP